MKQKMNYQKKKVLSLCCQRDYDLLTGAVPMNLLDFERLTYLIMILGYSSYQQAIERQYPSYAKTLAEQAEREADILVVYPEYFTDEDVLEKYEEWIQEFLIHIPSDERSYYQELIKINIE